MAFLVRPSGLCSWNRSQGDTAQDYQKQGCNYKGAAPSPVFNNTGMGFAADEVDPELTECPQISIEEKARGASD